MPSTRRRRSPGAPAPLSPPRHGRAIPRERLFLQLDACASRPATWIYGPAGFGKSTLIATYRADADSPTLWLQLDEADAQPTTLIHHVDQLCRHALGRRWRLPAPTVDDLRDPAGLLQRRLLALAARLAPPWTLVLDNLQSIDTELLAGMAAALEGWPAGARLIGISRAAPPPSFVAALASERLGVIDSGALRFTAAETQQLIALHGRDWDARTLQALSGGWAAAMTLLLAGTAADGPQAQPDSDAAVDRLFALFAADVLDDLDQREVHTLMAVSCLPAASASMAVAISGDAEAPRLLADLARRSLFTEVRAGPEPVYTFHMLFASYLQARAQADEPADRLAGWRREAARLLADGGRADEAIPRLLDLGADADAAALLRAQAAQLVADGRGDNLRQWIGRLPQALQAADPTLLYWLGHAEAADEPAHALQTLARAHAGFLAAGDPVGSFRCAAAAADAIVFLGDRFDALAPWLPVLEAGIDAHRFGADPDADLRVLPGLLAAYVHLRTDDPRTAGLADRAEALLEQPLAHHQRLLLGTLAFYLLWTGQLARLDRLLLKLDRLGGDASVAPATRLRWLSIVVLVDSLLGRADRALAASQQALALAAGRRPLLAQAHPLVALAPVAARDAPVARRHPDDAARWLDPANFTDATTWSFQRGMLALLDGDGAMALRLMNDAVASGQASGWPLREHIALIGRALAQTEVGQFDAADTSLAEARAHPFQRAGPWHHWIEALVEADLADRRGDVPRCRAALQQGLGIAQAHGYDFGPLPYSCAGLMPRLVARALADGIEPALCRRIVRRHALAAPDGADERWPWALKLRCFGRFTIEREDDDAPPPRKEGRKPTELLKLTLAAGGAAPVDALAAALWPDAEGDLARKSFDNALHRLRKRLGSDHALLLRSGTLSLNAGACWTDLRAADSLIERAEDAPLEGDPGLGALAARLLDLTAGPLFAGDEALPALLAARDRWHARWLRALGSIGERLDRGGQAEAAVAIYRRALEQDPLAEPLTQRLMRTLAGLGRSAEALEAYRHCRRQLGLLRGVPPAAATEALAAALQSG